jgi:hypothetical protein
LRQETNRHTRSSSSAQASDKPIETRSANTAAAYGIENRTSLEIFKTRSKNFYLLPERNLPSARTKPGTLLAFPIRARDADIIQRSLPKEFPMAAKTMQDLFIHALLIFIARRSN